MAAAHGIEETPSEREIVGRVRLCRPDGSLDPAAVGWSRLPQHVCNLKGWGRKKRWEYWAIQDREKVFAMTISDLDYANLHAWWFLDPHNHAEGQTIVTPPTRMRMPGVAGAGIVGVRNKSMHLRIEPSDVGFRLSAESEQVTARFEVSWPAGHESMAVVVPWSNHRFQYTVKANTLVAVGSVTTANGTYDFNADAFATWDFGRGKWPYSMSWNWGSGSGTQQSADGTTELWGLQFGGKWTDGTGSTENAIMHNGTTYKVSEPLIWSYQPGQWLTPWRVRTPSGSVDMTLQPSYDRSDDTNLLVIANKTHQVFGRWSGTVQLPGAPVQHLQEIPGWAEEVVNKW